MSSAVLPVPTTRQTVPLGRPHVRDLNPAAVSAGISAFIFYVAAPVPLLIAVAGQLGLDAAHTSSWFFIVFASTAATSIVLSLVYRQPLPFNWSLPGLLYLGSLAGHYSFPELVGANVMAGAVIVLIGLLKIAPRLVDVLPLPIAMSMFAGGVVSNLSGVVTAVVDDLLVAGGTVAGYLLGRLIGRRSVPPVGLAAVSGALVVVLAQRVTPAPIEWTSPVVLLPQATYSWSAFIGVSLPLVVLSVVLGNVPALGYLRGQGYRVRINLVTLVVGVQSLFNAVFGGHQALLGRSGVAILAAPGGRAGSRSVLGQRCGERAAGARRVGRDAAGGAAADGAANLSGRARWSRDPAIVSGGNPERPRRSTAIWTDGAFLVAATPISAGGIPSAFWSLLAGLLASHLVERAELRAVRAGASLA